MKYKYSFSELQPNVALLHMWFIIFQCINWAKDDDKLRFTFNAIILLISNQSLKRYDSSTRVVPGIGSLECFCQVLNCAWLMRGLCVAYMHVFCAISAWLMNIMLGLCVAYAETSSALMIIIKVRAKMKNKIKSTSMEKEHQFCHCTKS